MGAALNYRLPKGSLPPVSLSFIPSVPPSPGEGRAGRAPMAGLVTSLCLHPGTPGYRPGKHKLPPAADTTGSEGEGGAGRRDPGRAPHPPGGAASRPVGPQPPTRWPRGGGGRVARPAPPRAPPGGAAPAPLTPVPEAGLGGGGRPVAPRLTERRRPRRGACATPRHTTPRREAYLPCPPWRGGGGKRGGCGERGEAGRAGLGEAGGRLLRSLLGPLRPRLYCFLPPLRAAPAPRTPSRANAGQSPPAAGPSQPIGVRRGAGTRGGRACAAVTWESGREEGGGGRGRWSSPGSRHFPEDREGEGGARPSLRS